MTAANLPDVLSTNLDIGGMTCAACAGRVERALHTVLGVTETSVSLVTEWTRVQGGTVSGALIAAVITTGYQTRVTTDKAAMLAVAGPNFWEGAGPVCIAAALSALFVLSMVAGQSGADQMLPPWVQWLPAMPAQFVTGARSYKTGWKALCADAGNMDLLVALGTSATYGLSLWFQWCVGADGMHHMPHLHFENTTVVIMLA